MSGEDTYADPAGVGYGSEGELRIETRREFVSSICMLWVRKASICEKRGGQKPRLEAAGFALISRYERPLL